MKRRLTQLVFLAAILSSAVAQNQKSPLHHIFVKSWQEGTETVFEQTIRVTLGPHQKEYTTEIMGRSGERYKLIIIHNPLADVKMEHWKIELRNIITPTNNAKEALGDNLLTAEAPSPNKHNFPQEDFIGYLYPHENPPTNIIGGRPFIESRPFYPITATRNIMIEGFNLILRVENFQRSKTDGNSVDFLDLTIEFRNACSQD